MRCWAARRWRLRRRERGSLDGRRAPSRSEGMVVVASVKRCTPEKAFSRPHAGGGDTYGSGGSSPRLMLQTATTLAVLVSRSMRKKTR